MPDLFHRWFGWWVFMRCPDGGFAPIIWFWHRREAQRWAEAHVESHLTHERKLEVHRYGWGALPRRERKFR